MAARGSQGELGEPGSSSLSDRECKGVAKGLPCE